MFAELAKHGWRRRYYRCEIATKLVKIILWNDINVHWRKMFL
jgi:hypothetical protein